MFDFLKRNKEEVTLNTTSESNTPAGFFTRLKNSLAKTRHAFSEKIAAIFLGKKELTPELLDEVETLLLTADVGVATTECLITSLTDSLARKELQDSEAAFHAFKLWSLLLSFKLFSKCFSYY